MRRPFTFCERGSRVPEVAANLAGGLADASSQIVDADVGLALPPVHGGVAWRCRHIVVIRVERTFAGAGLVGPRVVLQSAGIVNGRGRRAVHRRVQLRHRESPRLVGAGWGC